MNRLTKILRWRVRHLSDKRFAVILSVLIGVFVGTASVVLKSMVGGIEHLLRSETFVTVQQYFYFALPVIGVGLTLIFIHFILRKSLGNGIGYLLYRVGRKSSAIDRVYMYGQIIASSLTVGFGGSVGLEGPMVLTGSAWGSNFAKFFHLNRQYRVLLLGCGSSAAIASMFNAPVAGVIFTLEVVLAEIKMGMLVPLLISSVTGTVITKLFLSESNTFSFKIIDGFHASEIPSYAILGIMCGLLAVFFIRTNIYMYKEAAKMKSIVGKWAFGGVMLGLLIFIFPTLYGEGYWTIKALLNGNSGLLMDGSFFESFKDQEVYVLLFIAASILLKSIATGLTKFAGGIGGVFAPSLLIGGLSGYLIARIINILEWAKVSESNFILVGMGGLSAAALHSPLTSIFLIAELTNGYELFVPLMLVAATAYGTAYYFEPFSFYTKVLAEQGDLIHTDKDKSLLVNMGIRQVIEKDLVSVQVGGDLNDLVKAISVSTRNIFPVVDEKNHFKGVILLDDVRKLIFRPELYDTTKIKSIMHAPPEEIELNENMEEVMDKFDRTQAWNLPVVNKGKYVGFVSKSKIFNVYRRLLQKESEV